MKWPMFLFWWQMFRKGEIIWGNPYLYQCLRSSLVVRNPTRDTGRTLPNKADISETCSKRFISKVSKFIGEVLRLTGKVHPDPMNNNL